MFFLFFLIRGSSFNLSLLMALAFIYRMTLFYHLFTLYASNILFFLLFLLLFQTFFFNIPRSSAYTTVPATSAIKY